MLTPQPRNLVTVLAIVSIVTMMHRTSRGDDAVTIDAQPSDRLWLVSTRHLTADACRVNLNQPNLSVSQLSCSGQITRCSLDDYFQCVDQRRNTVVYVHGNRMNAGDVVPRALLVYHSTRHQRSERPIDWVIWSWPSEKRGMLIRDFRQKADRTDAQGLYLSWLLRRHAHSSIPTALIGYSFGARIVTGGLHALAGGRLSGRNLPGPPVSGAAFDAGLVAPAIDSHWLTLRGKHGLATKNLDRLLLMYNRRDPVLKRYWLLDRVRGAMALGFTGPRAFAPRADGSELSVRALDFSTSVGLHHSEVDYYRNSRRAGAEMADLIHDIEITN